MIQDMQAFPTCCYIRLIGTNILYCTVFTSSTFIPCSMLHIHTKQNVKSQVCTYKFCSQTTMWEMKKMKQEISQKNFRILHNCLLQDHNVKIQLMLDFDKTMLAYLFSSCSKWSIEPLFKCAA